jgi:hypothetical protein
MVVDSLGIEGYHDAAGRFPLRGIEVKKRDGAYKGSKQTTYGKNVVLKGRME